MTWRVAKSLDQLLKQINAAAPNRSIASDGSIGDAAHASRDSDHNPWVRDGGVGVVTARDFTHDPKHGFDSYKFADMLKDKADPRIKYIISNKRIWNPEVNPNWRVYGGKNPHNHHVHVSVKSDKAHYDDVRPWVLDFDFKPDTKAPPPAKVGSVSAIQGLLNQKLGGGLAHPLKIDGKLGPVTLAAIKAFQARNGLVVDGQVGPATWEALSSTPQKAPEKPTEAPGRLKVSPKGISLIKEFEGCRLDAHQVGGVWHIGIGHSSTSGKPPVPVEGMLITEEEAEAILKRDLEDFEKGISDSVTVPLTQGQYDALISIAFNKGVNWFKKSALLEFVNQKDWEKAGIAILSAVPPVTHQFYKGLSRRRKAELELFRG